MGIIVFFLNPILYIFYRLLKYKTFLKKNNEYLFAISMGITVTYFPYVGGDSLRYGFKYYSLRILEGAKELFLPNVDILYYNTLYIFSFIGIPYNIFVTIMGTIIAMIILKLLKKNSRRYKYSLFLPFILTWVPNIISNLQRTPLALFICSFGLEKMKTSKKYIILIFLSTLIHKITYILIILYCFNNSFYKVLKKINLKRFSIFSILISNFIYGYIDELYQNFSNIYIISKAYGYKKFVEFSYRNLFDTKLDISIFFAIGASVLGYLILLFGKQFRRNKEYYFLIILGNFIMSFIFIVHVPYRFCMIFNLFFVLYCLKNNYFKNKKIILFKILQGAYISINLIGIIYYNSVFYYKKYDDISFIFYPTLLQIAGVNNKYNDELKKLIEIYPNLKQLGTTLPEGLSKLLKRF